MEEGHEGLRQRERPICLQQLPLTVAVGDVVVGQVGVGAAPGEVGRGLRGGNHGGRAGQRVARRPRGGSAVDKLAVRLDAGGVGEARGGAAPGVGGHGEEEVVGEERLVGLDVVGNREEDV